MDERSRQIAIMLNAKGMSQIISIRFIKLPSKRHIAATNCTGLNFLIKTPYILLLLFLILSPLLLSERINEIDKAATSAMEIRSAMGAEYRSSSTLGEIAGKINIKGKKQTTSRTVDDTTANTGFPTAWKMIEFVFTTQPTLTSERKMRIVFSPNLQ